MDPAGIYPFVRFGVNALSTALKEAFLLGQGPAKMLVSLVKLMKALSTPHTPFSIDPAKAEPVLLIDDDDDAILLIQLLLKRAQVTSPINIATDGEQAVAYFQARLKNPAVPRPHIIFLDLKLPRRDGFEVLKWIRAQPEFNRLPIVIMSSSNRPLDMENARAFGADFYCEKYPALEDLVALFKGKTFFPPLPTLDFG